MFKWISAVDRCDSFRTKSGYKPRNCSMAAWLLLSTLVLATTISIAQGIEQDGDTRTMKYHGETCLYNHACVFLGSTWSDQICGLQLINIMIQSRYKLSTVLFLVQAKNFYTQACFGAVWTMNNVLHMLQSPAGLQDTMSHHCDTVCMSFPHADTKNGFFDTTYGNSVPGDVAHSFEKASNGWDHIQSSQLVRSESPGIKMKASITIDQPSCTAWHTNERGKSESLRNMLMKVG